MATVTSNFNDLEMVLQEVAVTDSAGGPGGSEFDDRLETKKQGDITEIRVWCGDAIDSLTVYYNGVPGQRHGTSPGGVQHVFSVPEGYRISEIDTWTGNQPHHGGTSKVLKGLRFITKPIEGSGNSITSEIYGHGTNDYKRIRSERGLPLRSISGNAGYFVDKLEFNFGYLFEFQNLRLDESTILDKIRNARLMTNQSSEYKNGSSVSQQHDFSFAYTVSDDYTTYWGGKTSLMLGIKVGLEAQFKMPVMEGKFTNEYSCQISQEFNYGEQKTKRQQTTYSYKSTVTAPPKKAISTEFTIMLAELDSAELLYDVVFFADSPEKAHKRLTLSAKLSGPIASYQALYEVKERELSSED